MKPLLALSTCWCSGRHSDGYAMAREMADLGFGHIELSHGIRISLVPGILRAVEEGVVRVTSTHNFCPLPTGVTQAAPNLFEPSQRDRREHAQWLRHSKRSVDFAAQVGASVLVTHLGSVRFFWRHPAGWLRARLRKRPGLDVWTDPGYRACVMMALERVRKGGAAEWTQVQASLAELREYALRKGVVIGCENRERLEELPLDEDFPVLFAKMPAPPGCAYWHDTGHAELKQRLGVADHREQLEANAANLAGFHLHDVDEEGRDHCAVGEGTIDFELVSSFWRPEHLLTLELSPRVKPNQVAESRDRIARLIARRFG